MQKQPANQPQKKPNDPTRRVESRQSKNDPHTLERGNSASPMADEPRPGAKGDDLKRLNEGNGQVSGKGEGDYTSAKKYQRDAKQFAASGKVEGSAQEAKRAMNGPEREELMAAEKIGRSKMKEEDRLLAADEGGGDEELDDEELDDDDEELDEDDEV